MAPRSVDAVEDGVGCSAFASRHPLAVPAMTFDARGGRSSLPYLDWQAVAW
jgi:hypothetical protein